MHSKMFLQFFFSNSNNSDMSIRETIRTLLLLKHQKMLDRIFGNRFPKLQKNGTRIGKRECCVVNYELNRYHLLSFGEYLKEKIIFRIRGLWWQMTKIKRGMALQISHPLYPTEDFFLKMKNQQKPCPNWKAKTGGYRPEYMTITEIFQKETGEILVFGDNFTIHEKRKKVIEDVDTGFLVVNAP